MEPLFHLSERVTIVRHGPDWGRVGVIVSVDISGPVVLYTVRMSDGTFRRSLPETDLARVRQAG